MKLRLAVIGLAISALAVAGWWWFSPWWVLHQVRAAADRNDAEAISDVIDYPRLRDSLKGEFNAALAGRIREGASGLGETGRAGAALGAVLASALVEKVVEAMVRPEFVVRAIREGSIALPGRSGSGDRDRGAAAGGGAARTGPGNDQASGQVGGPQPPRAETDSGKASGGSPKDPERRFQWRPERISADRLIVWVSRADGVAEGREFGLVFERRGFSDWKLAAVRLPASATTLR